MKFNKIISILSINSLINQVETWFSFYLRQQFFLFKIDIPDTIQLL